MSVKFVLSSYGKSIGWKYSTTVPRKMFGPKKERVMWGWRRLHNEELYSLYYLLNSVNGVQIKEDEMDRAHGTYGEEEYL